MTVTDEDLRCLVEDFLVPWDAMVLARRVRDRAHVEVVEALRIADGLTLETQTIGEAVSDLVRLVREARDSRDEAMARRVDAEMEKQDVVLALRGCTERADRAEAQIEDLETQLSSMVSARDLTIRDLRAELAAEPRSLPRMLAWEDAGGVYRAYCPACRFNFVRPSESRFCRGRRLWGFLWWVCPRTPHMHHRCSGCGWSGITAPATESLP